MPTFSPDTLASWTGGRWTAAPAEPIVGFATDTRTLRPGEAFVALRTEKRDGHDFLPAAAAAGAAAAIVAAARPEAALPQLVVPEPLGAFQAIARAHRRRFRGPVVGISGSAGKTSTKNLLALLLGEPVLATAGNLNNHLGVPLTLTRLDPAVHHFAVVEAGISAPGEMAPLAAMIDPDVVIITLVAPAHLAALGGVEGVAREKAVLAAAARPGGVAIFPAACEAFAAFRELRVRTRVVAPAPDGSSEERPNRTLFQVEHGAAATTVTLGPPAAAFELPRVSDGMAQNAALALCAASELGVPTDALRRRARDWRPAPLRGEWRRTPGRLLYLDCYNANPASMADALAAFCAAAPAAEPRLFVLGGMEELGAEAEGYHRSLGRRVGLRRGDFLCVLGAHAEAVRAGALEAGGRPEQIETAATIEAASSRLAGFRGAVFVKGSRRYALERLAGEEAAHA